jgi:phosphatidate cytidylyltransferase
VAISGSYFHGPSAQSLSLVLLVLGTLAWVLLDVGQPRHSVQTQAAAGPDTPARSRRRGMVPNVGATFLLMLWVPFLASFLALLLARPDGQWLVLAVVALSAVSDIGAYFAGTRFGRRKLAPSVSPAKTWEGAAGGVVAAFAVAVLVLAHFPGLDWLTALVLAGGIAVASTVGDLTESLIKRELGVKDLGRIVPGHGGIMDRADAVIFSLPVAHLLLVALGA